MASSGSVPLPPSLEELSTRGATTLLLPWIVGMAAAAESSPREVAIFVHQPTRSVTLVEGSMDMESLLREIPINKGHLPATKASIESLPQIQVVEPGLECAICLSEFQVNGETEANEMPCTHKFHSGCICKWLSRHGSCPICRFSMPVDEKKEGDERGGWRIRVFVSEGRRESETYMDTGRVEDQDLVDRNNVFVSEGRGNFDSDVVTGRVEDQDPEIFQNDVGNNERASFETDMDTGRIEYQDL